MIHTKGPWRVIEHSWEYTGVFAGDRRIAELRCSDEGDLDDLGDEADDFESSEVSANAKLIAAAPDLLECLLAYVELEEQSAPYSSSPMRERARAVIAKATGA